MSQHEIILKPSDARDLGRLRKYEATIIADGKKDFLLERSPRFRRALAKVKQEEGGMSLSEYRKSRGI